MRIKKGRAVREEITKLQDFINKMVDGKAAIKLLDAGCGSTSYLHFEQEVYMTGIDVSEKQLQRNANLNEKILGDIQDYDFQPSSFDVIVCWDVLEHLPKPDKALHRFASAMKEEGIVILKLPNVFSLKGLLTKYLPYPLHVLIYKYMRGVKNAGKDGTGPFKTYLKFSIAPAAIRKFAANNGLRVVYFDTYDALTDDWLRRNKIAHTVYKMLKVFTGFVSLGNINDSEFIIVLQKATGRSLLDETRIPGY